MMSTPSRALQTLAGAMHLAGYSDHADRIHRLAVTKDVQKSSDIQPSPGIAALVSLAEMYSARANYAEAIRLYRRVIQVEEERYGREAAVLVPRLFSLASLYDKAGDSHEAFCARQRISSILERQPDPESCT